jgi:hypothetical protein
MGQGLLCLGAQRSLQQVTASISWFGTGMWTRLLVSWQVQPAACVAASRGQGPQPWVLAATPQGIFFVQLCCIWDCEGSA